MTPALDRARALIWIWQSRFSSQVGELRAAAESAHVFENNLPTTVDQQAVTIIRFSAAVGQKLKDLPVNDVEIANAYGLGVHPNVLGAIVDAIGTAGSFTDESIEARRWFREKRAELGLPDIGGEEDFSSAAFESCARVLESAAAIAAYALDRLPRSST